MSKVKQIINIGNKEKLSTHVETIFKRYSQPGLHICDLATGGGKSYTIGKLTCEYYPKYFDKIIILCVKKDLVNAMNEDIDKHIDSKDSLISKDDKIVVKSNTDALLEAIPDAINSLIKEFREGIKKIKVERERKKLKSTLRDLINNLPSKEDNKARLQEEVGEKKGIIRSCIKSYLTSFKGYYFGGEGEIKKIGQVKNKAYYKKFFSGYVGLHVFWDSDFLGEEKGSLAYISGGDKNMKILDEFIIDKVPHTKRIMCLEIRDITKRETEMMSIIDMLKYGFGKWNIAMSYPLPFKFMQEYLDLLCCSKKKCHWENLKGERTAKKDK